MSLRLLYLALVVGLLLCPLQAARADSAASPAPAASGSATSSRGSSFIVSALKQCNLTKQQWGQIKNIHDTTPAGKARLQRIYGVLTPAQQAQFKALLEAHKKSSGSKE
jgi:Spy/CpxP family protein refolding chaperone